MQPGDAAICAIILAAGSSRRMAAPKLLLPWGDRSVLGATLRQVAASRVARQLVVTGAYHAAVAALAAAAGVPHVHNPDHAQGEMLSSLQVGLRALGDECAGALVVLGDMPLVQPATIDALIDAFAAGVGTIIVPHYRGQRGHPVLFSRAHFAALLALPPGGAPRDVVVAHPQVRHEVAVDDPGVTIDLDDPAVYARWRPA